MVGGAIADSAPTTEPRVRAFPSRGFSEYGPLSLTPCAVNGVVAVSMQQCEIFAAVVGVIAVAMVHFWGAALKPPRSLAPRLVAAKPVCYEKEPVMSKEKVAELLRENYPYLASEYGVRRIGLFGSYAKGTPGEVSDVDMVVEFEHPIGFRFVELAEYLEGLLGKKVDVLTPAGIHGIRIGRIAEEIEKSIVYV